MTLAAQLEVVPRIFIRQRREMIELFGLESRNKYSIETESGDSIGFAAEQGKGIAGTLVRQLLGHWRSFEIRIFDRDRRSELIAFHPFRFYFHRLEICTADGRRLGAVERRFSILTKTFDVHGPAGEVIAEVSSPLWRPWTYIFRHQGIEIGAVRKKWGGLIREAFLDADSFAVEFAATTSDGDTRLVLLGAAMFIDVMYFEKKGTGPFSIADLIPG
ncbi:MAG TPA: phospholipid scramblase-related protein [Candidatus Binatia bacterium]|nr:phospholipid scramblase-related protein [Candidatus Binatia bacterium]